MSPQAAWQRARYARINTLGLFAALGILGGAFVVPVMAQQSTNQSPVAQPDMVTTAEETAVTIAALANDSDPDGGTLTITGFVSPTHGTVVINSGTSITYTPAANYSGTDTFAYTVSDGQGGAAVGTVIVTVTGTNDPPVAVADVATSSGSATTIALLANDTDSDGDTLSVASVTQGAHGTVGVSAGGIATYTPVAGYSGTDTFTYIVTDGHGGTATGTVTVTISAVAVNHPPVAVNHPPVAVNDSITVKQDTSAVVAVLANDTDADSDTLSVGTATAGAHGTVTVNANSTITFMPAAGYVGSDVFTYTVRDVAGLTASGSVNVTVAAKTDNQVPDDKDFCKEALWRLLGFKNQGLCVSAANHVNDQGGNNADECNIALALALLSDPQLPSSSVRNILNGQANVITLSPIVAIQPVIVQPVVTVKAPVIANGGNNNSQALISFGEKAKAEQKAEAALKAKAEAKAKAETLRKNSKHN